MMILEPSLNSRNKQNNYYIYLKNKCYFLTLLKYKLHRVTSKVSEPRTGLRKVCSWPDVVYISANVQKIMFIPYIYII